MLNLAHMRVGERGGILSTECTPSPCPSPYGLRDSHIAEVPAVFDGLELGHSSEHDDGAGFAVIAGPAAEPGEEPGGPGERAWRVRVLLLGGVAFQARADRRERRAIVRI